MHVYVQSYHDLHLACFRAVKKLIFVNCLIILSSVTHACLCTELPWSTSGLFQSRQVDKLKYLCWTTKKETVFFSYYVMIKEIKRLWVIKMSHKSAKCIHGFSDIDEYKGLTLVTWMLPARTPKDRMFVLVTPDILEMDGTAHVLDAFLL